MEKGEVAKVAVAARKLHHAESMAAQFKAQASKLAVVAKSWMERAEKAEEELGKLIAVGEEVQTPSYLVKHVKSTRPSVIVAADVVIETLPEEFKRRPDPEVKKDAVRDALQAGRALTWARLEWSSSIKLEVREKE